MSAVAGALPSVAGLIRASPRAHPFRRLLRRRGAAAGLAVIVFFVAIAVLAPVVSPYDPLATSWSAVRKSDGMVVMAIWAKSVQSRDGGCGCLLWAPNGAGARPWSDTPAGRERREHCKLALEHGCAEGLLVHGESLEGRLPEDRARTVLGIDPKTTITFKVELRGNEYWARWGTTP